MSKKRENSYLTIAFTAVVSVTTMFLRLPTPAGGYFNFGDVAVVFSGLLLGKYGGLIAGGFGSAIADLISGFGIFAPLTFIAKGTEGFVSGLAKGKNRFWKNLLPLIGALLIVPIYFIGEGLFMPQIGFPGAATELLPNLIQAIGGYIGGKFLFETYIRINKPNDEPKSV